MKVAELVIARQAKLAAVAEVLSSQGTRSLMELMMCSRTTVWNGLFSKVANLNDGVVAAGKVHVLIVCFGRVGDTLALMTTHQQLDCFLATISLCGSIKKACARQHIRQRQIRVLLLSVIRGRRL